MAVVNNNQLFPVPELEPAGGSMPTQGLGLQVPGQAIVREALEQDSQAIADAQQAAKQLKLPPAITSLAPGEAKMQAEAKRVRDNAFGNPVLTRYLHNPEYTTVFAPDIEELGYIEEHIRAFGVGYHLGQFSVERGQLGEELRHEDTGDELGAEVQLDRVADLRERLEFFRARWLSAQVPEAVAEAAAYVIGTVAGVDLTSGEDVKRFVERGGEGDHPELTNRAVRQFGAANPLGALLLSYFSESSQIAGGNIVADAEEAGVSLETIEPIADVAGTAVAALDLVGVGIPLQRVAANVMRSALKEEVIKYSTGAALGRAAGVVGVAAVAEGITEGLQTGIEITALEIGKDIDEIESDLTAGQVADAIYESVKFGMMAGAGFGAVAGGIVVPVELRNARRARATRDAVDKVAETIQATAAAKTAPSMTAEFVADTLREQNIQSVGVAIEAIDALPEETRAELLEAAGLTEEQLELVRTLKGDVTLSNEQLAELVLQKPDVYAALKDDIRYDPEGMTAREGQEFQNEGIFEAIEAAATGAEERGQTELAAEIRAGAKRLKERDTERATKFTDEAPKHQTRMFSYDKQSNTYTPWVRLTAAQREQLGEMQKFADKLSGGTVVVALTDDPSINGVALIGKSIERVNDAPELGPDQRLVLINPAVARNALATVGHETLHVLYNLDLFTPEERKLLDSVAPQLVPLFDRGVWDELTEAVKLEEAVAEAFEAFLAGDPKGKLGDVLKNNPEGLRKVVAKLVELVQQVREMLGLDSKTGQPKDAQDVFEAVQSGTVGARTARRSGEPTDTERASAAATVELLYEEIVGDPTARPRNRAEAFAQLARGQRNIPERRMLQVQRAAGGGVVSHVAEHVGDLTHRMTLHAEYRDEPRGVALDLIEEKVRKTLNNLRRPYGFQREHEENMRANARSRGITVEEHTQKVDEALHRYADAHQNLRVYNKMQRHARDAAVAIGRQDWAKAIKNLEALEAAIGDTTTSRTDFRELVQEYDADYDTGARYSFSSTDTPWRGIIDQLGQESTDRLNKELKQDIGRKLGTTPRRDLDPDAKVYVTRYNRQLGRDEYHAIEPTDNEVKLIINMQAVVDKFVGEGKALAVLTNYPSPGVQFPKGSISHFVRSDLTVLADRHESVIGINPDIAFHLISLLAHESYHSLSYAGGFTPEQRTALDLLRNDLIITFDVPSRWGSHYDTGETDRLARRMLERFYVEEGLAEAFSAALAPGLRLTGLRKFESTVPESTRDTPFGLAQERQIVNAASYEENFYNLLQQELFADLREALGMEEVGGIFSDFVEGNIGRRFVQQGRQSIQGDRHSIGPLDPAVSLTQLKRERADVGRTDQESMVWNVKDYEPRFSRVTPRFVSKAREHIKAAPFDTVTWAEWEKYLKKSTDKAGVSPIELDELNIGSMLPVFLSAEQRPFTEPLAMNKVSKADMLAMFDASAPEIQVVVSQGVPPDIHVNTVSILTDENLLKSIEEDLTTGIRLNPRSHVTSVNLQRAFVAGQEREVIRVNIDHTYIGDGAKGYILLGTSEWTHSTDNIAPRNLNATRLDRPLRRYPKHDIILYTGADLHVDTSQALQGILATPGAFPARFERYTTPGLKSNYHEHLITNVKGPGDDLFSGVHFPGRKDIIVHTRTTDRQVEGVGRVLVAEEIQSDQHQKIDKKLKEIEALEEAIPEVKLDNDHDGVMRLAFRYLGISDHTSDTWTVAVEDGQYIFRYYTHEDAGMTSVAITAEQHRMLMKLDLTAGDINRRITTEQQKQHLRDKRPGLAGTNTWTRAALKWLIELAAEGGYDAIAIPNGEAIAQGMFHYADIGEGKTAAGIANFYNTLVPRILDTYLRKQKWKDRFEVGLETVELPESSNISSSVRDGVEQNVERIAAHYGEGSPEKQDDIYQNLLTKHMNFLKSPVSATLLRIPFDLKKRIKAEGQPKYSKAGPSKPIEDAQGLLGLKGFFDDATQAGLTPRQYQQYLLALQRAAVAGERRKRKAEVNQELREIKGELAKARGKILAEVEAEVNARPEHASVLGLGKWTAHSLKQDGTPYKTAGAAKGALKKAGLEGWSVVEVEGGYEVLGPGGPDNRLDFDKLAAVLKHELGIEGRLVDLLPRLPDRRTLYQVGGTDPDVWAGTYGYASAADMVKAWLDSDSRREVINNEVERRFGELPQVGRKTELEQAKEAVYTDDFAEVLAFELNALREARKQKAIRPAQVRAWAQLHMLDLPVNEITPSKLESRARKLARQARKELREGKRDEAARSKFQQLIHFQMAREAYKVREMARRDKAYLGKFNKAKRQKAGLPPRYLQAVKTYMERAGFATELDEFQRIDLEAFLREVREEEGVELVLAPVPEGTPTLREYIMMVDTVRELDHVGRQVNKLLREAEQASVADRVAGLVGAVEESLPQRRPGERPTVRQRASDHLASIQLNPYSMVGRLDKFVPQGPAYQALLRPYVLAMTSGYQPGQIGFERRFRDMSNKLKDLWDTYGKSEQVTLDRTIEMPGVRMRMTKGRQLSVLLNLGNDGNRQALLDSNDFTEEELQVIVDSADERDWHFVQSVWDLMETLWPDVSKAIERRKGKIPVQVKGRPIATRYGTFKGGYYPLYYDRDRAVFSSDSMDDVLRQAQFGTFTSSHTADGHTKERRDHSGKPVKLDPYVMHAHIKQVVYDLEVGDAIRDIYKVLHKRETKEAFFGRGHKASWEDIDLWFRDVVTGELHFGDVLNKISRHLRAGFVVSKLGFNIRVSALQLLGTFQSAVQVGKYDMLKGVSKVLMGPYFGKNSVWSYPSQHSAVMQEREFNFNHDITAARTQLSQGLVRKYTPGESARWFSQVALFSIIKMQRIVDVMTWYAAQEKGMRLFDGDFSKSVEFADQQVLRSQASGVFGLRSKMERGSVTKDVRQQDWIRALVPFISYFMAKNNVAYERTKGTNFLNPGQVVSWATDMAMLFAVEAAIIVAITEMSDDEDEDLPAGARVALDSAITAFNGMPLVRDVATVMQGYRGGGVIGSVMADTARLAQQVEQGELDYGLARSALGLGGTVLRVPGVAQVLRGTDAARDKDSDLQDYLLGYGN